MGIYINTSWTNSIFPFTLLDDILLVLYISYMCRYIFVMALQKDVLYVQGVVTHFI